MSFSPQKQTSLIIFSTVLAGFSLASIVNFTDPSSASWVTFGFFYLSLFLTSLGIFSLIGLMLRQWLSPGLYVINLSNSFRQSVLLSLLISVSFWLSAKGLLYWWVEGSLILFLAFIEIFLNLKV
jgi:hypothetical protein